MISPETWLRLVGVRIEERPPSRMGRAGAKLVLHHDGVFVRVDKSLPLHLREWNLWHEAAHVVDVTKPTPHGVRVGRIPLLGYGLISLKMATALRRAEDFLVELTPCEQTVSLSGLPTMTMDQAFAHPEVTEAKKSWLRRRMFDRRARHLRYKTQPIELFAEAVACAICDPGKLEANAPGLLEELRATCEGTGLPL